MPAMFLLAAADAPNLRQVLKSVSAEDLLLPILVQLIVIIAAARLFAMLLRRLGQPAVVGEIFAGLVLGPSVLGRLFPDVARAVFHPGLPGVDPPLADMALGWILTTLSNLGLIFLLFLMGLEFDFAHLRVRGKSALAISIAGVALPFGLGLALAPLLPSNLEQPAPPLSFALFLGTALAITAIPVLGRIMIELNITRSRLGAICISAAAIDDAIGWILLAAVTAVVHGNFQASTTLWMMAETIGFALSVIFLIKPAIGWWSRRALRRSGGDLRMNDLAVLLAILFGAAIVTNRIGIFAIFGAFLLGAALSSEHQFRQAVAGRLRDFVTAFFLPIFFTFTGLRTDVGSLGSVHLWLLCGLVLAAAVAGKLGGCSLAAWLTGCTARESACVGAMMNTRGLMELVVINVGYDLGVIPRSVFCMLVIMAIVTTVMTTPLLVRLGRGTELEELIRQSGFLGSRVAGAAQSKMIRGQRETS